MGFRYYRRKSLGHAVYVGASKSGLSVGRRGTRVSGSVGSRGLRGSLRIFRGLSYVWRKP